MLKRSSKTFLCLLVFLFVIFSVTIVSSKGSFSLGIQGGVNFANVSVEYLDPTFEYDFSKRMGMMFGFLIEREVAKFISIQADILYVQKGAVWELGFITTTFKLDYIEMPVLFKAKFGPPVFKINMFAGPNLGILISAHQEMKVDGQVGSVDIKALYRNLDIALDFGGGFEFAFTPKFALFINIRYSLGVIGVYESQLEEWKLNGTQILAGTKFTL